jgi:hypothetical protein
MKNVLNLKLGFILISILILPIFLDVASDLDENRGLIWFALHQLYYLPFGVWIGEPLFVSDNEIMFKVLPLGRIVVAILNCTLFFTIIKIFKSIGNKKLG